YCITSLPPVFSKRMALIIAVSASSGSNLLLAAQLRRQGDGLAQRRGGGKAGGTITGLADIGGGLAALHAAPAGRMARRQRIAWLDLHDHAAGHRLAPIGADQFVGLGIALVTDDHDHQAVDPI